MGDEADRETLTKEEQHRAAVLIIAEGERGDWTDDGKSAMVAFRRALNTIDAMERERDEALAVAASANSLVGALRDSEELALDALEEAARDGRWLDAYRGMRRAEAELDKAVRLLQRVKLAADERDCDSMTLALGIDEIYNDLAAFLADYPEPPTPTEEPTL